MFQRRNSHDKKLKGLEFNWTKRKCMTERSMIETLEHKEKHDEFEEQNILMAEHFI